MKWIDAQVNTGRWTITRINTPKDRIRRLSDSSRLHNLLVIVSFSRGTLILLRMPTDSLLDGVDYLATRGLSFLETLLEVKSSAQSIRCDNRTSSF